MRRIRIAYLPASLERGGAERQMLLLAERLPRDRFEVEFVALSGPGEDDARALAIGLPLRYVGRPPAPGESSRASLARLASKFSRYAMVARRKHYDIVDAWLYPSDVIAALMKPFTRSPIVISGRRNIDPQDRFGLLERPLNAVANRLTDAVVANSAATAAHAIGHHAVDPAKVRVIRNGVALIEPLSADERARSRRAIGAEEGEVVIGCVANYRPVKEQERLIDAFKTLVDEGHRVRLVLVGEGPLRQRMEDQIRALGLGQRVRLHGSVADPPSIYGAFDLAVQTSSREGLPNALLEAAAAGLAIVATDAGGSAEIVLDGRTGMIVPVNDPAALTRALRLAVSDGGMRSRMGAAGREHVATTFGIERFVAEFARLYEALAGSRTERP